MTQDDFPGGFHGHLSLLIFPDSLITSFAFA